MKLKNNSTVIKNQVCGDKLRPKWVERIENPYDLMICLKGPIMDVGAGISRFKQSFEDKRYLRLDIDFDEKPDVVGDALNLPIKNESFNSLIYADILEHTSDPFCVIREAKRILKSGGMIFVSIPFLYPYHPHPEDYFRFTSAGIRELLEREGFIIEKIRVHNQGIFSCINRWAIAWTYDKPYWVRILIQPILHLFVKLLSFIDLGKESFYVTIFCLAKKA